MPFSFPDDDLANKEDYQIRQDDDQFIVGKIEDEFSALELYVYEKAKGNLYVHHDIMLSSFPLCLEWLCVEPSSLESNEAEIGNYAIVGTFYPDIEIWNQDVLDAIEPAFILAGEDPNKLNKIKKKKKSAANNNNGHSDAITSQHLNTYRKNILASGSADTTVKIWDLTQQKPAHTLTPDDQRVEVVKWHPKNESLLLTISDERFVSLIDLRQNGKVGGVQLDKQAEGVAWDCWGNERVWQSFEDGSIGEIDAQKNMGLTFDMKLSSKSITSISANPEQPGVLATSSQDGFVRLFDVRERDDNNCPKSIYSKMTRGGKIFFSNNYRQIVLWGFQSRQQ